MKTLLITALALFLLSPIPSALALDLTPGLWKIDMTIKQDGREIDPMSELREAMKDMPEDQRKQMMQAMEGSGLGGPKGIQQCYTKEMIEKAELGVHEDEHCKTKTVKKSASKIVSHFTCKDGSKGAATVNIKNSKSYTGHMKMTEADGAKSEMTYQADFVSKDCADVEPVGV